MFKFLNRFLDSNQKELNRYQKTVEQINALEPEIRSLTDEALQAKTNEFKKRIADGETLEQLLPEAFAVVREATQRTIGQRQYDVQLMAGITLHEGKIAEQKTGEGKTLSATAPVYLNALLGKGVHVVTPNDYLSKRDAEWMGNIYHFLGLSVATIPATEQSFLYEPKEKIITSSQCHGVNLEKCTRQEAYAADITYGTNNEFGFDYLRDNMVQSLDQMVQRGHFFAIVDEVDFILVDEARTPLIISAPAEESNELYIKFAQLVPKLLSEDYAIDEKARSTHLTDLGVKKIEQWLGTQNLFEDFTLAHHLDQALKAQHLYHRDKDYIVKEGEVIIVDEFTGRLMPGRRYSEGLHQAIEAKESVPIQKESKTLATITFQNYFRMYQKLAGMTGTAATEAEEFHKIYNLDVIVLPTHKPMIRKDQPDLVYKHQRAKYKAVADDIERLYKKGQPVLVGTTSVEKNQLVSNFVKRRNIPHEVLNAKNHEREAEIIAKAGQEGAVTIATNLAGRGVDIALGQGVIELGGLFVLGTERHEARRIDNQLRGRSGRQGDAGESRFFVALDDDLMRIFGGERIASLMTTLKVPEEIPIESGAVSKAIENAQVKVEGYNFDIRKHLVEYDDVINKQREIIYHRRRGLLGTGHMLQVTNDKSVIDLRSQVLEKFEQQIQRDVAAHVNEQTKQIDADQIAKEFSTIAPMTREQTSSLMVHLKQKESAQEITDYLIDIAKKAYQQQAVQVGEENMRQLEKLVMLSTVDRLWMDHIDALDELRLGVGLRGYGQRDPLVEFKNEAYAMFDRLLAEIDYEIVHRILRVQLIAPMQQEQRDVLQKAQAGHGAMAVASAAAVSKEVEMNKPSEPVIKDEKQKIGRNDPCWCGSGKKYKKCHGKAG